jgi:hypothetical protein
MHPDCRLYPRHDGVSTRNVEARSTAAVEDGIGGPCTRDAAALPWGAWRDRARRPYRVASSALGKSISRRAGATGLAVTVDVTSPGERTPPSVMTPSVRERGTSSK